MNLFRRLFGSTEASLDPSDERIWTGATGSLSEAGTHVNAQSGLQIGVVQAVLEVLGGTVSTLPLMVFRRTENGGREPDTDHPLYRILHRRPSDLAGAPTAQEFREELTRHLAWWRNAYARILPGTDGSPVGGLDLIHPSRIVRIERARDGHLWYTISALGVGSMEVLRDDQIWHIRKAPLTDDGLRGKPVFETAREELGHALAVDRFGARYFRNSGKTGGVIKHPGRFRDEGEAKKFIELWRSLSTGSNQHRDRLLTNGAEYQPLDVKNDEAQFIETLKQHEVKVARLWQMPPHRVGILDRATFSNIEFQGIDYVVYTLAPWIAAQEQAAERDLLVGSDRDTHFVEFNVAGLLRGDIKARFAAYAAGRQWGWLSVNEVRRLENMAPIGPDGDRYLEPKNMGTPAGSGANEEKEGST